MVTNYPQHLTATSAGRESSGSLFTKLATRMGQLLCGVRGHEAMRHFEDKRVTSFVNSDPLDSRPAEVAVRCWG
jgi:hypothetical protein